MKKTLFLSAILATALCSSAFATDYDITTTGDKTIVTATAEDTITFNQTTGYLYGAEGTTAVNPTINAKVVIDTLYLTDGYSGRTITFENKVSGTGNLTFASTTTATNQYYVFNGDMTEYSGNMSIADNRSGSFTFNNNTTGTGSISGANVTVNLNSATSNASEINVQTVNVSGDGETVAMKNVTANRIIYTPAHATHVELSGTNTLSGMLDLSTSSSSFAGDLTLKSGASLTQNGTLWLKSTSQNILLEENATYTHGWLTIKGLSSEAGHLGQLHIASGSGVYDMASTANQNAADRIELINVATTIAADSDADTTLANKLVNSSLTYTNSAAEGKTLTLTHADNTLTGINMGNGATLKIGANMNLNGAATLNTLTLSGGNLQIDGGTTTAANVEIQSGKLLNNFSGSVAISGTVTNNGNLYQQSASQFTIGTLNNTGRIIINSGKTLTVNNLTTTAGTIEGAGTLFVNAGTTENNTTIDFDSFKSGSNNTIISLKQAKGTLKEATNNITNKIVLTNGSWAAAEWINVEGSSYTFTNAITGDGNFVFNGSNGQTDVALTFTGDLSGWNSSSTQYNGLRAAGAMNLDVTLSGSLTNAVANAFNADNGSTMALTVDRNTTLAGRVHVTELSVSAGKTVTASNSHVQIANSIALGDSANLTISAAGAQTTGALTLGSGATLTLGSAAEGGHNYNLTTSTLTVNGASTLNANLVVSANGTMDFSGAIATGTTLTMGCSVEIGDNVTVVIDDSIIEGIVNRGETVAIITDAEAITSLEDKTWHFQNAAGQSLDWANLRLEVGSDGTSIVIAPEPATATLSLLALAALASRRKRH